MGCRAAATGAAATMELPVVVVVFFIEELGKTALRSVTLAEFERIIL